MYKVIHRYQHRVFAWVYLAWSSWSAQTVLVSIPMLDPMLATCLAVVQICISKTQLQQLKGPDFSVTVVISFAEELVGQHHPISKLA